MIHPVFLGFVLMPYYFANASSYVSLFHRPVSIRWPSGVYDLTVDFLIASYFIVISLSFFQVFSVGISCLICRKVWFAAKLIFFGRTINFVSVQLDTGWYIPADAYSLSAFYLRQFGFCDELRFSICTVSADVFDCLDLGFFLCCQNRFDFLLCSFCNCFNFLFCLCVLQVSLCLFDDLINCLLLFLVIFACTSCCRNGFFSIVNCYAGC